MKIQIYGAREHNLKDINLEIPRNSFVILSGVSGSGKSSLAFDTIYAEAQRQYLESLSSFARRFLSKVSRPDVDQIKGLSPSILIDQKPLGRNPRSTVGTVTEIYTLIRLLFSRLGTPRLSAGHYSFNTPLGACENCKGLGNELLVDEGLLLDKEKSLSEGAIRHRTWKAGSRYWNIIQASRFFDMKKPLKEFSNEEIKKLLYSQPLTLTNNQPGYIQNFTYEGVVNRMLKRQSDSRGLEIRDYDKEFMTEEICKICSGSRLNSLARSARIGEISIVDVSTMPLKEIEKYLANINGKVADAIIPTIFRQIRYLVELKVGYLSLNRSTDSLSGGEAQRIKLSRQLNSSLTEMIYILDEPTTGLHPKDTDMLVRNLVELKDKPNSLIVVEHDLDFIEKGDFIIDLGPGPGAMGGRVIAEGSVEQIRNNSSSVTGKALRKRMEAKWKQNSRKKPEEFIEIKNITKNNLKNITVRIPKNLIVCLTGVSGAGKSSLVEVIQQRVKNAILIDQTPVGSSPRSITATYVEIFDLIREEISVMTGKPAALFSFNSEGACEECSGLGYEQMDMHFLDEVKLICEKCKGKRYNDLALSVTYRGKNIAEILDLTVTEAIIFFVNNDGIIQGLKILDEVGLGYLTLGQSLDTFSGGEAQRLKIAKYLGKKGNFYILDEPTTGLHYDDTNNLITVLRNLADSHNTILLVEHNLDVMLASDWIIDLGPDGGDQGGSVIAFGPPEKIAEVRSSYTGQYLSKYIK